MREIRILELIEGAKQARGLTVIIDVLRAFSLECYLYDMGAALIRPVGQIPGAVFAFVDPLGIDRVTHIRRGMGVAKHRCGKKPDRIKGLVWEGDGFLLLYKRINIGTFKWPRSANEAVLITEEQYALLMQGFEVIAKRPIMKLENPPKTM